MPSQDDLVATLDALSPHRTGYASSVCEWLSTAPPDHIEAARRAIARGVAPTTLYRNLKDLNVKVSQKGIADHCRPGKVCEKCRTSLRD